jgi:hypothetical protein
MQHLYEGYKNLTQRILEPKATTIHHGSATPRSFSGLAGVRGVVLAQSASTRFERLGDRLHLLILSETQEFLAEKEALISTVGPHKQSLAAISNINYSISISMLKRTPRQPRV